MKRINFKETKMADPEKEAINIPVILLEWSEWAARNDPS